MDSAEKIFSEAINLRPAERLQLIEMLAKSLDKPNEEIEQLWAKESEERYSALSQGKVKTIPLDKIIRKYR